MGNIIMETVNEKSVSEYSSLIAKIRFFVHNRNSPKLCACQTGTITLFRVPTNFANIFSMTFP